MKAQIIGPALDCSIEEFDAFCDSLEEGEILKEYGEYASTDTGVVVKRDGQSFVRWNSPYSNDTGIVTNITTNMRRA